MLFAALLIVAKPLEFVPAPEDVKADVVAAWQKAADGDAVWTARAQHAQAAYDALCAREPGLSSVCRSLGDQARCGMVRGLKPRSVAVSTDGKSAEILVKTPGDELALFLVRAQKVGAAWRVDGVRCPAALDKDADARAVPAVVARAVKSIGLKGSAPHVGAAWPAFVDQLPPDPGVGDPAWFLPDENCHVRDGTEIKAAPAGPFFVGARGLAAVVKNNDGERYLAYFERDPAGTPRLVDARCALPPAH